MTFGHLMTSLTDLSNLPNDGDHSAPGIGNTSPEQIEKLIIDAYVKKLLDSGSITGFAGSSESSSSDAPGFANGALGSLDSIPGNSDPGNSDPVDDFTNDQTGGSGIDTSYGFLDFLKGLIASQGAENKINRDFNSAEAAANREFQARESQIQRQWYEQMSNSAYQRAVADMKKAGINPILAYAQGGAATATTGLATGSAASYGVSGGDTLSSLVNSIANLVSSIGSASAGKYKEALALLKGLL